MGSCGCVYVDHDSGPEFINEKWRKARKEHVCTECGEAISPRQRYFEECGLWDGVFNTYKTCEDCMSVRDEFFCSSWFYGEIWEDLGEHIRAVVDVSSDCLVKLTPGARAKVCDMIEENWEVLYEDEE